MMIIIPAVVVIMWKYIKTLCEKGKLQVLKGEYAYFVKVTDDGNLVTILDDVNNIFHIKKGTIYHNTEIYNVYDIHSYDGCTYVITNQFLHIFSNECISIIELTNMNAKFIYDVLVYKKNQLLYQLSLSTFKTNKIGNCKGSFAIYRDYVTLSTSISKVYKKHDLLIIFLNGRYLLRRVRHHRFKSVKKYHFIDKDSICIHFKTPYISSPVKSWIIYIEQNNTISSHIETIRVFRPLIQINKIFVCLKDMFFILTKKAFIYALQNNSFYEIIHNIDREDPKFIDCMYFGYSRSLPTFNDDEHLVMYIDKSELFVSKTTYPFELAYRTYGKRVQSHFFTKTELIVNNYSETDRIYL